MKTYKYRGECVQESMRGVVGFLQDLWLIECNFRDGDYRDINNTPVMMRKISDRIFALYGEKLVYGSVQSFIECLITRKLLVEVK